MDAFGVPEKHHILCPYCQKTKRSTEQGCVRVAEPENGTDAIYTFVSCDTCNGPVLYMQEDLGQGWGEMVLAWPRSNRHLSPAVPRPLRNEHEEARKCFDAKAYTAAAVMVGRTLEGVCAENGFKERNLIASIRKMKELGKLDERLYEWANELRVLRNEGAHYTGSQVSREDASDALALSEAMLDYLYVLTARFDEFKQRRTKSDSGSDDGMADSEVGGVE